MKLTLHVDTNDYNEYSEQPGDADYIPEWSLFGLQAGTFQQWRVIGQTGFWTVDGETFCGTAYECEVNYTGLSGELLLRGLIAKIKEVCKGRFIRLWVANDEIKFTDGGLVCMPPDLAEYFSKSC